MHKYKVLWPHVGDKSYVIGDIRIADPIVVAHLVPPHGTTLEDLGEADADDAPVAPLPLDLETEIMQLREAHASELQSVLARNTVAEQELADLRAQLEQQQADAAGLQSELIAAQESIADVQQQLEQRQTDAAQTEQQLKDAQAKIAELVAPQSAPATPPLVETAVAATKAAKAK